MEIYTVLSAVIVCFLLRETLTCQERDVEDISRVLVDVPDWKGLADWLDIGRSDIEANCAKDIAQAACYRREVVRRYCNSQLSGNPSEVAEKIAQALEQMEHKRQAEQLKHLQCDGGCGGKQASGEEPKQLVQELADLPPPASTECPTQSGTECPNQSGVKTVLANIKHLRDQFIAIEDATQANLNEVGVQVEQLLNVIYSLPTAQNKLHQDFLSKYVKEFKDLNAIGEVFLRLDTHKYWDYLNIDLLEHIITEFSLPCRTRLEAYKKQLQQFMEETTVKEFYEAEGDRLRIDPPPAFVKLVSQHEWKPPIYLKKVDEFHKKFAHKYDLRESAVILMGMRVG